MPDAKQMSGVPLPTGDLPDGAVSVRLVRGQIGNNIANHPVELHIDQGSRGPTPAAGAAGADPQVVTVKTDDTGRAQFQGTAPGTRVHAVASVGGERLETQEFEVPQKGGVRVLLVASSAAPGAAGGEKPLPPQPGTVVFGGQSRVVIEASDEGVQVYYLLEVVNTARAPIAPAAPLILEVPKSAQGLAVLEGSSPQATAAGGRVTVTGPFQPGTTTVSVAYQLPQSGGRASVTQRWPAAMPQFSLIANKIGGLTLTSAQIASRREMTVDGQTWIAASGPGIPAGGTLALELAGLPHHSTMYRTTAVVAVLIVLGIGVWLAATPRRPAANGKDRKLETRREQLFGELVRLEEQRHAGRVPPAQHERRRANLIGQLERVYAELDREAAA